MTEPDHAGSNPVDMSTTAVKDGDDYVINGRKWFTTSADGAAFAIVMAVTNPDAPPHGRASQILVPTDTAGFELVRNIPVMGHTGSGWASHGEIDYRDVRVPQTNLLGPEGAGFLIAQQRLGPGRIHHCMRWIGISERCFELMCRRALDWEMATIGDPLMDLGTTLSYWVEATDHLGLQNLSFGPTHLPGMPTRRQLADSYAERTGRDVGTVLPCYVYGLHKTAAVLQQIYYRYRQGLTQDPRFALLIEGVKLLAHRAAEAVEQGSI